LADDQVAFPGIAAAFWWSVVIADGEQAAADGQKATIEANKAVAEPRAATAEPRAAAAEPRAAAAEPRAAAAVRPQEISSLREVDAGPLAGQASLPSAVP